MNLRWSQGLMCIETYYAYAQVGTYIKHLANQKISPFFKWGKIEALRFKQLASKGQSMHSALDMFDWILHALHLSALLIWEGPDTEPLVRPKDECLEGSHVPGMPSHALRTVWHRAGRPPLPGNQSPEKFTCIRDSFLSREEKATRELLRKPYFWPWERIAWCCQWHRNHRKKFNREKACGVWNEWMKE